MHADPKIIEKKKHLSIDVEQIISFEFSAFCLLVLVWWHYFGSRSTLYCKYLCNNIDYQVFAFEKINKFCCKISTLEVKKIVLNKALTKSTSRVKIKAMTQTNNQ